ncbi:MAG TPA: VWA domain-containing protein [Bryobacteraceae bacterium]|nr:VWA domain-containing protein [Bryobacteraceae bacterium]
MRIVPSWILATALAAPCLLAQTPAAAPAATNENPTFKAKAEETVLDVVVRDKKGRQVNDLKQSDFTVIDNGEARPIKSFRIVEGTAAINSSGGRMQLDPLRQLRLVTLVFQGGDQNAKKLARDAALELIKGELAQNVYISVFAIDHRLQALQPFTNDRDLLRKAIARATASVNDYTNDTIQVRKDLEQMLGPVQGGDTSATGRANAISASAAAASGPGAGVNNPGAEAAMVQLMLTILKNASADESSDWSRASVFPLLDLVKEQYRLPGRKTVLYFSGGFPINQDTEDPFKQIISICNRSNVSFYSVDINGLTTWNTADNATGALQDAASASMGHVTSSTGAVSTWDAKGADAALDAGKRDTQLTLKMLAEQTGGTLIANTNDFRAPIKKVTEDIETYYEITYDPQIEKYDGAFRKVQVKTDIANLRVQSRAGYFALPPNVTQGTVLATYEVPLLQVLDTQPLKHDFDFESAAMHFRSAGGGICDVVVDIPVGGMTFEENKQAGYYDGKLAYVAVVKDAQGQVVKKLRQEVPLRVTPDKLAAYKASSHFIYSEGFSLAPGRYTLETAAMDMTSQKVSARKASFVIPAPSDALGVSSVSVIRSVKGKEANAKADDPMATADKEIMPTVNPVLKKSDSDQISFYLTVYPDKKNTAKASLFMVFSKDGQILGKVNGPPLGDADAQGRIQYVTSAPAKALPPGKWDIRFVVQQGQESADESVGFTLE